MSESNGNVAVISTDKLIDLVKEAEQAKAMIELMQVKAAHQKELEEKLGDDVWYGHYCKADADRKDLHDQLDTLEAENDRLKSAINFIEETKNG